MLQRGPIFLVASVRAGWNAALAALFVEMVFCAISAGFYGAIVQDLRNAEPEWLTGLFVTIIVPMIFQVLEYVLHWLRGTPHLRMAGLASAAVSGISGLFNWYAMRRGTLLVGEEGRKFGADLKMLPRLILNFLLALPRRLVSSANSKRESLKLIVLGLLATHNLGR